MRKLEFRLGTYKMLNSGYCLNQLVDFNNPKNWQKTHCFIKFLVENGPEVENNLDVYPTTNNRQFSKKYFYRILPNGDSIRRKWMFYCIQRDVIFCFPCLLFGCCDNQFSNSDLGFNDWRNVLSRLKKHEDSAAHKKKLHKMAGFSE